jgi:hypothetical protein
MSARRSHHSRTRARPFAQRPRSFAPALAAALACAAAFAPTASAASPPSVGTDPAQKVTYSTAVLNGAINPQGQDTSYFFQYGTTKSYGSQTGVADAGKGTSATRVSVPISGLQPVTTYHFRLIAVNARGASTAGDAFFTTAKVPLSLAILVSPNPVTFGEPAVVQGTLSGTGNGQVPVALEANPFPYLQGFTVVGNPELTTAGGGFSFPVVGLEQVTHFRVVTISGHPIASPITTEEVAVRVNSHIAHTSRRHFARIYGTVAPAEDGAEVGILKVVHGRKVLVAGTFLRHRDASSSSFSRVLPVGRGAYLVLVRVLSGAQVSNYGRPLLIH